MIIGALEAGGTKMVCALGKEDGSIIDQISIPTTTPEETIPKIIEYFKDKGSKPLGIGTGLRPVGVILLLKTTDIYWKLLSWPGEIRIFWVA